MDGTAPTCRWGSPFDSAGHALVLASFIMTTAPTREPTAPISASQKPKPRLVAAGVLGGSNPHPRATTEDRSGDRSGAPPPSRRTTRRGHTAGEPTNPT